MNAKDLNTSKYSSHIVFITGGTKSGKSEFAEHLAKEVEKLSYVALSENNLDDKEWQDKINLHRKRRPKEWKLICLLYTSPSPRDRQKSRMPSSA